MESRKSGEKSRSLEQRRLVMPCNDGEATRRPVRAPTGTETRREERRREENENKKKRKERERGGKEERGKKQLPSFIFLRTKRKSVPGSTESSREK